MSSDNRLVKLGSLLESKNRTIRNEAASVIGQMPLSNVHLLPMLRKYLQNSAWDTRVSAADALGRILAQENAESSAVKICGDYDYNSVDKINGVDLVQIIDTYRPLLCSEGDEMNAKGVKVSTREQRTLVDKHLNLESRVYSSRSFLHDTDIDPATLDESKLTNEDTELSKRLKQESTTNDDLAPSTSISTTLSSEDLTFRHLLAWIIEDVADEKWQTRHGGFLALHKVVSFAFSQLTPKLIELVCLRVVEVLALDRFIDFATGSNSVAPVRETAAQCLCVILCRLPTKSMLTAAVHRHLTVLLGISDDKKWQCRQTSLIVLKYYFAAGEPNPAFFALINAAIERMGDPNDEVVSAAIVSLASVFSNSRLLPDDRRRVVRSVMTCVWQKLKQPECLKQLRDGVDSVLTDLVGIVNVYAQVEPDSNLSDEEFRTFVDLLDPRLITRTLKILECLGISLSKSLALSDDTIFQLLKMLFRCCLFAPPADSSQLLDTSLAILNRVVTVFYPRLPQLEALHNSIGYWIGCLMVDDKKAEIHVFLLNIDGPTSIQAEPIEYMGGNEICAVSEADRPHVILGRKIMLARFLAPLVDVLYRSGLIIRDQPIHVSVQLIFVPYLRSTVLAHRLGAALMINCWARLFRFYTTTATSAAAVPIYPEALVAECLNAIISASEVFTDVIACVQTLTTECTEFMRYCRRNGAKPEEASDAEVIDDNLFETTRIAFEAAKRSCKPQNAAAVEQRFQFITHLIKHTRATIRTNANRVNALLGSALFYFGYTPEKFTPMIRPLMEAIENDDHERMAAETLEGCVPLMLQATAQRLPCPHAKIIRQVCLGLVKSESYTPSLTKWTPEEGDSEVSIISLTPPEPDDKAHWPRNAEMVLNACFTHFGAEKLVNEICTALKTYLSLDLSTEDLEAFLLNVDVIRAVLKQWKVLPTPEQAGILGELLRASNPAARCRVCRLVLEYARSNLPMTINLFFPAIEKLAVDIENDSARAGASELLFVLSSLEEKLVGATSLLAPLAFAAVSDKVEVIRETAAAAFRKMVTILPIEKDTPSVTVHYQPEIANKYRESLNFLNVLSAPGSLPHLTTTDIPNLEQNVDLRGYQLEGITWMMFLHKFGLNGILADDMGLGKTLQTLCLLSKVHTEDSSIKGVFSLIVCPKTLVNHWCNEWIRYFVNIKPLRHMEEVRVPEKHRAPIVVASYDELRHSAELRSRRWNYVILDEGHCIRNHTTQLFEAVSSLVARHRLILSGTPVQNSPADLWALFRFLMPGYLSTRSSFHQKYIKPMLACRNPKATDAQTKEGEEALALLHRQILPFLLRRLKTDVLAELPEKVVQDCLCQLTDLQKKIYTAVVDRCSLMREASKKDEEFSLSPLHTLISLRKLVDHPVLIADVVNKLNLKEKIDFGQKHYQSFELSGKLVALKELLAECQISKDRNGSNEVAEAADGVEVPSITGHRALIFCQWRSSIDMLAAYLDNGDLGVGISYVRLDGTVAPADRQSVVDHFNRDESIDLMLLTTHIGGVGLNLTGADVVIFLDHDWNPVKDLQAIDRAHRLGQKRTVNVYRLITQGSIEEKVMRYQKFKSDTANVLVGADNRSLGSMATDELLELFTFDEGSSNGTDGKPASGDAPRPSKRRRTGGAAAVASVAGVSGIGGGGSDKWCVEDLWDNSQYDEQHDVAQFLRKSNL